MSITVVSANASKKTTWIRMNTIFIENIVTPKESAAPHLLWLPPFNQGVLTLKPPLISCRWQD